MADAAGAWDAIRTSDGFDYELTHITQPLPVKTGVMALDDALGGGIPAGTFTVVAGEAGTGKSALACVIAYNAALRGRLPLFLSMEMPKQMVVNRMLSVHSARIRSIQRRQGVPDDGLMKPVFWSRTGTEVTRLMGIGERADMLTMGGREQYEAAQRYMRDHGGSDAVLTAWRSFRDEVWQNMAVLDHAADGSGQLDITECVRIVCDLCESGVRPYPLIDYLQLGATGDGDEYERVTRASTQLATVCKAYSVPMVVISALRKIGVQERKEDPNLGWLHGTGRIGYDAGTVIILKRDGEPDGVQQPVVAHIVKNRVGQIGKSRRLMFNGARNLFHEPRNGSEH